MDGLKIHRILKPTSLATMTSTVVVFLQRKAMEGGFASFLRTRTRVLWPHQLFSAIYEFHPQAFAKYVLGGSAENVTKFWRTMPRRRGVDDRVGWDRFCIPLGAHGDGVAISNARGPGVKIADTLSWTSLLSTAPTRFSSYLIYFCFSHVAKKTGLGATWSSFWKLLARSFRILFSGIWPATTMDNEPEPKAGRPLAGGFYGLVYINKGDLDWLAGHFKVSHASSRYPCTLCGCSNLGNNLDVAPWSDTNDRPSWEPTCWTGEAWFGECLLGRLGGGRLVKPDLLIWHWGACGFSWATLWELECLVLRWSGANLRFGGLGQMVLTKGLLKPNPVLICLCPRPLRKNIMRTCTPCLTLTRFH